MPPPPIDELLLTQMREDAARIFKAGLAAVEPHAAVKKYCRVANRVLTIGTCNYNLNAINNIYIIGAGKATAPMAAAIEEILGTAITDGIITVKYDHGVPLKHTRLIEAGHPVPDKNGCAGAREILALAQQAGPDDLVVCLLSGGGSALLPLPVRGITLKDKQTTNAVLLACGGAIDEINAVRKHLSAIKGGRLARAVFPARLVTLVLSDVVGDNLDVIASGPTVPDSSTFETCRQVIRKYGLADKLPESVNRHLNAGFDGRGEETPKDTDALFQNTRTLIIGSNYEAVTAAGKTAARLGYEPLILTSLIEGESVPIAKAHGAIAREVLKSGNPIAAPACILSGGETTVTLSGTGKGGRNQHFALAAAIDIADSGPIVILSAGTDGTDGPTDAAGAIADANTLRRAQRFNLSAPEHLHANNAYPFFEKLNNLLITGPTHTNVMDLHIVLVKTGR